MTSKRAITFALFASFFILGLTVPLLGVTTNNLTVRFGMAAQNGGLFQAFMSAGVVAGTAIAGRYYDRLNARIVLPIGSGLLAASMVGLALASTRIVGLLSALVLGLGFGSFLLGPNLLIARLNPNNAAGALNAVNVAYGIGAIAAPQLVTVGNTFGSTQLAYAFAAVALLLITIPLAFVNMMPPERSEDGSADNPLSIMKLLPFIVLFFCAMGAEVSFNAWIVTQLQSAAHAPLPIANLGASMFWVGYTFSRVMAAWLGRRVSAISLLLGTISIVGFGIVLMLLVPANQTIGLISACVVGIGIGPLFPTNVALVNVAFPRSTGQAFGFITSVSNIGPLLIPWIQGQLGAGQDGGMEILLVLVVILMIATLAVGRQLRLAQSTRRA